MGPLYDLRPDTNQKITEKPMMPQIMTEAQFIVTGVTGETDGIQRITPKKPTQMQLIMLSGIPNLPKLNGPLGMSPRTQMRRHSNGKP